MPAKPVDGDREQAENLLGRELRELPEDLPGIPAALRTDLAGTPHPGRAGPAVLQRRGARHPRRCGNRRLSRLMRLHASRPLPRYFDIDDRSGGVDEKVPTAPVGRTTERPYDRAS